MHSGQLLFHNFEFSKFNSSTHDYKAMAVARVNSSVNAQRPENLNISLSLFARSLSLSKGRKKHPPLTRLLFVFEEGGAWEKASLYPLRQAQGPKYFHQILSVRFVSPKSQSRSMPFRQTLTTTLLQRRTSMKLV